MEQDKDPGIQGKKLSKSDSEFSHQQWVDSVDKVLNAQIAWTNNPTTENKIKHIKAIIGHCVKYEPSDVDGWKEELAKVSE